MDPVSLIVMALASGAAAGLKPTAAQAVRDAYSGIKKLIAGKYGPVDLAPLEQKPESEAKRASLKEDLEEAGAGSDVELLDLARMLTDAVAQHDPGAAASVGIDLEDVKAQFLEVGKIDVSGPGGTGLKVKRGEFSGGIKTGDVEVRSEGRKAENPPPQ